MILTPWDVNLDVDVIAKAAIPTLAICGDWDRGFTAVARHLAERLSRRLVEYARAEPFFMANGSDIAAGVEAHWTANNS